MSSVDDWQAVILTLQLALITGGLLLIFALPLAWWLAGWRSRMKTLVLAIVALPLVLPPTVLGFYLLLAFAPDSGIGEAWQWLTGEQLAFSFSALVLGSLLYSLPFAVQPLYTGFEQLDRRYLDAAATLGMSRIARYRHVVFPLIRPHLLIAFGLTVAHTIGEFGVVLMIGGNIPGETQVLSIALYDHVEALDYPRAHAMALALLGFSFVLLMALYQLSRKPRGAGA
ncbi:molybdate ABC transporter permease subunit [Alteromonas sp. ASW11-19]|uniref:Molybdenum transport system permease n=1 Tax=Alteromonas salexigens TaxID=2982530 RepID=A0ABT2VR73_9ALTE|nr:molybdate ABC transporter permease subunit [Alteromonas salexigens]MCU7555815.1 molybdate ABC transporter permease subunit [Alteromonas salexigens]